MKRTIPAFFRGAVDEVADNTWLLAEDRTFRYAQALEQVSRGAAGLRAAGVAPGDGVLVTARNTWEYLLAGLP